MFKKYNEKVSYGLFCSLLSLTLITSLYMSEKESNSEELIIPVRENETEPKSFSESINQSEKNILDEYTYESVESKLNKKKILELKNEVSGLNKDFKKENEKAKKRKSKINSLEKEIDKKDDVINKKNEVINDKENEIKKLKQADVKVSSEKISKSESRRENKSEDKDGYHSVNDSDDVNSTSNGNDIGTFVATYYGSDCSGCSGVTATGVDVRNTTVTSDGHKIIAVDPSVIPFNSVVKITNPDGSSYTAKALDSGGKIKNKKIDVLVGSESEANEKGIHDVQIEILK